LINFILAIALIFRILKHGFYHQKYACDAVHQCLQLPHFGFREAITGHLTLRRPKLLRHIVFLIIAPFIILVRIICSPSILMTFFRIFICIKGSLFFRNSLWHFDIIALLKLFIECNLLVLIDSVLSWIVLWHTCLLYLLDYPFSLFEPSLLN
jgi:hypothetical protein